MQGSPFSDVGAQEGLGNRRGQNVFGENRLVSAVELYWKMVNTQGVVMGAWELNLLQYSNGLKPELLLKLPFHCKRRLVLCISVPLA